MLMDSMKQAGTLTLSPAAKRHLAFALPLNGGLGCGKTPPVPSPRLPARAIPCLLPQLMGAVPQASAKRSEAAEAAEAEVKGLQEKLATLKAQEEARAAALPAGGPSAEVEGPPSALDEEVARERARAEGLEATLREHQAQAALDATREGTQGLQGEVAAEEASATLEEVGPPSSPLALP
jgi:hypothetical protein